VLRLDAIRDPETLRQVAILLERENDKLHAKLQTLTAELARLRSDARPAAELELEFLKELLAQRERALFGASSEQRSRPATPPPSAALIPRRGHGPTAQPTLPTVEVVHELAAADVIASLDPRASVDLYRQLQPLCEEAYRELGHPPSRFDDVVAKAIQTLLATPVVEGEIELRPKVVTYAFADPRLEALSPAQRHFLRMGPRNVRLIQGELRTLAAALGVPAGEPRQ